MRPARVLGGGLIVALMVIAVGAWRFGPDRTWRPRSQSVAVGSSTTSSPVPQPPSIATATADPPGPLDVVRHGLRAWGRFAVTGDLREMVQWFDPDGPQFARFVEEAGRPPAAGSPYSVDIQSPDVEVKGSTGLVRGRVTFARVGERPRSYSWILVLERSGGSWIIWTVKDEAQATS